MNNEKPIIVGLDIGTTKIAVIAGRKNEFGKLEILGFGKASSSGVKHGQVLNIDETIKAVRTALDGKKGIVYDNLIALLIEAMKQQDLQIIRLQSDLNNCCTKTNESNRLNIPNNNGIDETNSGSYINQNNPNPFNKETIIEYFITERNASASVLVFDMNGKLLKTLKITNSGKGSITINANDFAPGMYYYSLVVNNKEIGTKKMILTE